MNEGAFVSFLKFAVSGAGLSVVCLNDDELAIY